MINHVKHNIEPIFNNDSRILILGSLPSPKSREIGMFYGHPQNRFWKIISTLFNETLPITNLQKKEFLIKHKIAVWDVVKECDIDGALDSTIKNVVVNNFDIIIKHANIQAVFTTGRTAFNLYQKHTKKEALYLPSPSPTNCAMTLTKLVEKYSVILKYL